MQTLFLTHTLLLLSSIAKNSVSFGRVFRGIVVDGLQSKLNTNTLRHSHHHSKSVGFTKSKFNLQSNTVLTASKRRKDDEDFAMDEALTNKKRRNIKTFQPKTPNQIAFVDLMRDDTVDIVIAIGPAGTGKTMLACYAAVEALRLGSVQKIVVTRPVVSVDEEIGFLPGGLESKMDPWTRPIFDVLKETYSAKEIEHMTEEGIIEIVPLGYMRGRTFKNAWIIADEMQNSSPTQMVMLATRIGEGSKMVITGDLNQSDRSSSDNGLKQIYEKVVHLENRNGPLDYVRYIEFEILDVQRSRAAKAILDIYSNTDPIKSVIREDLRNTYSYGVGANASNMSSNVNLGNKTMNMHIPKDDDAALIPLNHISKSEQRYQRPF